MTSLFQGGSNSITRTYWGAVGCLGRLRVDVRQDNLPDPVLQALEDKWILETDTIMHWLCSCSSDIRLV